MLNRSSNEMHAKQVLLQAEQELDGKYKARMQEKFRWLDKKLQKYMNAEVRKCRSAEVHEYRSA